MAGRERQAVGMAELLRAGVSNTATQYGKLVRLVPSGVTSQGAPTGTSQDRAGPAISGGFGR